MRFVKITICLLALLAVAGLVAGCGGGGSKSPLDMHGFGTISNSDPTIGVGYHIDRVRFTATRDGEIEVGTIPSGDDPLYATACVVWVGTDDEPYDEDVVDSYADYDRNGYAGVSFYAEKGTTYTAAFGAAFMEDRGSYEWAIKETTDDDYSSGSFNLKGSPKSTTPQPKLFFQKK